MKIRTLHSGSNNILSVQQRIDSGMRQGTYKSELSLSEIAEVMRSDKEMYQKLVDMYYIGYETGLHAANRKGIIKARRLK